MEPRLSYISPSLNEEALQHAIAYKLMFILGKDPSLANKHEWLNATLFAVRDRLVERWLRAHRARISQQARQVYYLSMEFLIGRTLSNALLSLGIYEDVKTALAGMGLDLEELIDEENDPGLGNGGLGRLAACFLDSLATLGLPGRGYGIRYDYGMFKQNIIDGRQMESPDYWLEYGNPWEFERHKTRYTVRFGGRVQHEGKNSRWLETEEIIAVAYDQIIPGYETDATNTLRLWSAQASSEINLGKFNSGDHMGALSESNRARSISRVLYPADDSPAGQELRLRQEYFFTSASLQDITRRHLQQYSTLDNLAEKVAIQLNDTHPALVVAELMRLLVDQHNMKWEKAWEITQAVVSYTNHTLLPEALERWSVNLMERMLPRHMQIIYVINARLLNQVKSQFPNNDALLAAVSLIDEHGGRHVRMGNLAFVGSHKVNGVSALHSDLMTKTVFRELHQVFPDRIYNVTNGITPRRWLMQANPELTGLLRETIGDAFLDDASRLKDLIPYADDAAFRAKFRAVKQSNKARLAQLIQDRVGVQVNPEAMFDVQVKRMHEYKRQHLNIFETIALYNDIRANPHKNWVPRVKIFAGKAAASYWQAKSIIRLINDVGNVINNDPTVGDLLKVVFIPNYNVSTAEIIMPAADLSEQISTAGLEASGTGNMKFALNGALTIGTLDGANVEILEHVGADNIKIFGMTAQEVEDLRVRGYNPRATIESIPALKDVLDAVAGGVFSPNDQHRYSGLVDSMYNSDHFLVAPDFVSYAQAQRELDTLWLDQDQWQKKAVLNTANMGWFSSDRTITEYAREIWGIPVA